MDTAKIFANVAAYKRKAAMARGVGVDFDTAGSFQRVHGLAAVRKQTLYVPTLIHGRAWWLDSEIWDDSADESMRVLYNVATTAFSMTQFVRPTERVAFTLLKLAAQADERARSRWLSTTFAKIEAGDPSALREFRAAYQAVTQTEAHIEAAIRRALAATQPRPDAGLREWYIMLDSVRREGEACQEGAARIGV